VSQIPAQPDGRFAHPGAGREYTFGQLLRIALRQFWLNKWRVLWVGLAVSLLVVAARVVLSLVVRPLWPGIAEASEPLRMLAIIAVRFLLAVLIALLTVPLMEGYKWATIRSFDRPRMEWADVFTALRLPWRKTVLLFALTLGAFSGIQNVAAWGWSQLAIAGTSAGPAVAWQPMLMILFGSAASMLALFLVRLLTFLVVPIVLSGGRMRLGEAFRENYRIIRGQPGRVLATVGIWTALELLAAMAAGLIMVIIVAVVGQASFFTMAGSGYLIVTVNILYSVVLLVPWAISLHLVAVIFRAAYGRPLNFDPAVIADLPVPDMRPAQVGRGDGGGAAAAAGDPLPGAGREYTFGRLLKIALRQFWRNKVTMLSFGLVVGFLLALLSVVTAMFDWLHVMLRDATDSQRLLTLAYMFRFLALPILVTLPAVFLLEGYKWATIHAFDRFDMAWADVFRPWRRPWRKTILLYALIIVVAKGGCQVAVVFCKLIGRGMIAPTLTIGWELEAMRLITVGGTLLAWALPVLATFLVGPTILSGWRLRLGGAVWEHFRIFRGQPRRVLAVVAIWVGLFLAGFAAYGVTHATLLRHLMPTFVPTASPQRLWLVGSEQFFLWLFLLVPLAISFHLVAALFRSAYGLPLEPATNP